MRVLDPAAPGALPRDARGALEADPCRHTIALSHLDAAVRDPLGAPLSELLVRTGSGGPEVLLRTATRPLVATALSANGVGELVGHLDATGPVPGVTADPDIAEALLVATGARATGRTDLRLFQLASLRPPVGVPGRARHLDGDDPVQAALAGGLLDQFSAEEGTRLPGGSGATFVAAASSRGHTVLLWWRDGEPVAVASARAPTAGACRIGPVWTHPERRGHGFGAAVTAAAAAHALRTGARQVCLYTDLANPASNRLYPRVGFLAVRDHRELSWDLPRNR